MKVGEVEGTKNGGGRVDEKKRRKTEKGNERGKRRKSNEIMKQE